MGLEVSYNLIFYEVNLADMGMAQDGTQLLGLSMYWDCPRYSLGPTCLGWLLRMKHHPFVKVALGCQFTKGSGPLLKWSFDGTEVKALLSPSW